VIPFLNTSVANNIHINITHNLHVLRCSEHPNWLIVLLKKCSLGLPSKLHFTLSIESSALLAEYAGAVLGVLSAALYGRKVNIWKKIGGLAAMLVAYYLLSNGWSTRTHSPLCILQHTCF